ncbi:MAG: hypothetical protein JW754_03460 [Candidatus Aenigmarchaeota archaeon]|nr:hypothetical protein [Candidatus Aenigmarchaeota archaeon]
MDEFVIVVIVALILIGAMMLIGIPLGELTGVLQPGGNNEIAFFPVLGRVGMAEGEVSRTISFGSFAVGKTNTQVLKTMPSFTVSTSLLGGEDSKKFTVDLDQGVLSGLKDVKVGFNINDDPGKMAECSNLIVRWNDRSFFSKIPKLYHYDVTVDDEFVKTTNTLEFLGGTPPVYCWGWNTMYTIEEMEVIAEYGPEKFLSFELFSSDIQAWDTGKLKFYTTSGQAGDLIVLLNGREIFRKSNPEHMETIELEYSEVADIIKIGDNVVTFKSTDAFSIDNAVFELYLSTNDVVREKDFYLNQDDMNRFTEGKINFVVDNVYRDGILKIRINGNEMNVQTVRAGNNTVTFEKSDVMEGTNKLAFLGSGSWDISNVRVTI